MQIVDKTRKESEKRFLVEGQALLFVQFGQDKYEDGENLRQVVDLRLIIVDS